MVRSEDLLGPLDGQFLDRIDVLTTSVIAFAGVAFGILVRHQAALAAARTAGLAKFSDAISRSFSF